MAADVRAQFPQNINVNPHPLKFSARSLLHLPSRIRQRRCRALLLLSLPPTSSSSHMHAQGETLTLDSTQYPPLSLFLLPNLSGSPASMACRLCPELGCLLQLVPALGSPSLLLIPITKLEISRSELPLSPKVRTRAPNRKAFGTRWCLEVCSGFGISSTSTSTSTTSRCALELAGISISRFDLVEKDGLGTVILWLLSDVEIHPHVVCCHVSPSTFVIQMFNVPLMHPCRLQQVLKVYPFPVTITTLQFAVGTVLVLFMWLTNLYKKPKITSTQLVAILPLAVVHTLGNLFTNMSLGKVAVSFTHTIKAMEPFFSVVLSAMFLGESPSAWVMLSLAPIVGGVALASLTEASFNCQAKSSCQMMLEGKLRANDSIQLGCNLGDARYGSMIEIRTASCYWESLDNITLFSVITIMSFLLLAPVTVLVEGIKFTPSYLQSAGLNVNQVVVRALVAGTGVALAGVFLYSRVKRIKPKKA
ncbi:hypothetical protein ACLOJK_001941 [Asimina triloba]